MIAGSNRVTALQAILAAEEQRRKAELLQKQQAIKENEAKKRSLPATPTGSVFNASAPKKTVNPVVRSSCFAFYRAISALCASSNPSWAT